MHIHSNQSSVFFILLSSCLGRRGVGPGRHTVTIRHRRLRPDLLSLVFVFWTPGPGSLVGRRVPSLGSRLGSRLRSRLGSLVSWGRSGSGFWSFLGTRLGFWAGSIVFLLRGPWAAATSRGFGSTSPGLWPGARATLGPRAGISTPASTARSLAPPAPRPRPRPRFVLDNLNQISLNIIRDHPTTNSPWSSDRSIRSRQTCR